MEGDALRFQFDPAVPLEEAESSLHLALFAAEGLFGQARVLLDAGYEVDPWSHSLLVDVATEVGTSIARIFTGLLVREFGERSFAIERDCSVCQHEPQETSA